MSGGIAVRGRDPAKCFTQVPNDLLTRQDVSAMAVRMWCVMWALPEGWRVLLKDLDAMLGISEDTALKCRGELVKAGYCVRQGSGKSYSIEFLWPRRKVEAFSWAKLGLARAPEKPGDRVVAVNAVSAPEKPGQLPRKNRGTEGRKPVAVQGVEGSLKTKTGRRRRRIRGEAAPPAGEVNAANEVIEEAEIAPMTEAEPVDGRVAVRLRPPPTDAEKVRTRELLTGLFPEARLSAPEAWKQDDRREGEKADELSEAG